MVHKLQTSFQLEQRRGRQLCLLLWLCFFLSTVVSGQIIGTDKLFGRYQQFVWQDQHGLPQNGISEVVQTPDGYLWLATAEGVVRFDGVHFTAFDTGNTPGIKSNNVQALLVDRNGVLWIGTHGGGLSRYKDGQFVNFSEPDGLSAPFIKALFEDHHGNLWVGTDGGGVNLFQNGKFKVYTTANGLSDNYISSIAEDNAGELWIGTRKNLIRFQGDQFTGFPGQEEFAESGVSKIFRDNGGDMWIGGRSGLERWHNGHITTFGASEGLKDYRVKSIAQDRDGTLWFGTIGGGLCRFKDGHFEVSGTNEGLINNEIQAVFTDSAGNIWLGTNGGGLAQLKSGKFATFTHADGLPGDIVGAIYEDKSGGIWVGTESGLSRFKNGKFVAITTPDGNSLNNTNGITEDHAGNIWITCSAGNKVLKYDEKNSRVEIIRSDVFENRAAVMLEDKKGNFWYGTSTEGLHSVDPNGRETVFHKQSGLADEYVDALYEDRQGSLWIGTRRGLSRFKDGVLTTFSAPDGFTGNHVLSFYEDRTGNLWIGTHGDGLFLFGNDKFAAITTNNGLYDNLAFSILEDDNGNLWMSGNKGIYRAAIAELQDFAAGRRDAINSYSYGSIDGMLSRECNGANPAGIKAQDGRLWFPTIKGIVVVDPKIIDDQPPVIAIEKVSIDSEVLPNNAEIKIQPGQQSLEIQFAALSWNRPSQIRFKYQLVGLDADWVESGTRRTAYYSHIPPGSYTFRIIADNGEGIWNYEGQSLPVVVFPPFYRSWWFLVLCSVAIGLIIRFMYIYRLNQLEKINEAKTVFTQLLIESQEQERKRIAVELHDSIGQSLIVIRNRALIALKTRDKHERIIAQLEEISESAGASIGEVRRIAHNLHPHQLEHLGLTTALETMIESAANASPIEFEKDIDDLDGLLTREAEINLYRIVQETLNNILKHSEATKVEVTISKNNDLLSILIKDNGKGFNTEHLLNAKSGLGLIGIRERAEMLGAKHEILSVPNQGATVSLQIALSINR